MSRSGYIDDLDDNWQLIRRRGAVASALRGKRGHAFLNEMLAAMDALPDKRLVSDELETVEGDVCAIGAVGKARGVNMQGVDPEDRERVADLFGIPHALACEIVYVNDEQLDRKTPADRFAAMRRWIKIEIWNARGCVENPTGEMQRWCPYPFGFWGTHLHYNAVVALNEV